MSEVESYNPPVDISTLMPRAEAEATIGGFEARIAALESKKTLALVGTATVGETLVLGVSLGVKRYSLTLAGAALGDRLVVTLTGAPQNGSVQDAYVSAANTVNIGVLVPAVGIGAVIAVPVAVYKVV
jgi:hypothetical protein